MFVNLLVWIVVIAITVLFGWLTLRSWRIKRWLFKIPALLVTGLLTLLLAVITFLGGNGLAMMYIAPAPVPDLTVAGTPQQIARGEYLVNVACVSCHGANDGEKMPLTGGLDIAAGEGEENFSFAGSMVTANLTPDGVLADRTDGELFRAIRYGFGKNGRLAMMSFLPYHELSDDDTHAIIAFLRSQEPVTTVTNGGDSLNLIGVTLFYSGVLLPFDEVPGGVITAPAPGARRNTANTWPPLASAGAVMGPT